MIKVDSLTQAEPTTWIQRARDRVGAVASHLISAPSPELVMYPSVERYRSEIRYTLQGWVGENTPKIIWLLDLVHKELGVTGDIAEIGVHQGMFLLLLAAVRSGDEAVIGLDLFDMQHRNVDSSGSGAREVTESAIQRYYPETADRFSLISADSVMLKPARLEAYFPRPVRLFSVDGGHTREHVLNDLAIAQEVVSAGGVVMLDDFFGPHWPSVTEGFYAYMTGVNRRLAPFLFFENKLYLTTVSDHRAVLDQFAAVLRAAQNGMIDKDEWKTVTVAGFEVLSRG